MQACAGSSAGAAGEELHGRGRPKRGSHRGDDRYRSLADRPAGRPGDALGRLRFAAVPPSGGWRHAGPPVAAPAFVGLPGGGGSTRRVGTPRVARLLNGTGSQREKRRVRGYAWVAPGPPRALSGAGTSRGMHAGSSVRATDRQHSRSGRAQGRPSGRGPGTARVDQGDEQRSRRLIPTGSPLTKNRQSWRMESWLRRQDSNLRPGG